jgi:hypothetical protein
MSEQYDKDTECLVSAGWKQIGTHGSKYGKIQYWDHPDHNDGTRGALTRGDALRIQKDLDKQWRTRNKGMDSRKIRFA